MGLFGRGNQIDIALLRDTPLFADFGDDELSDAAKLASRRDVKAGETVVEQGRFGDACYVISEGTAAVYFNDQYATAVAAPTAVGEMALLERRPRNATVIAETDMVLAEFKVDDFRKLLERYPAAELRVTELLSKRLRENENR